MCARTRILELALLMPRFPQFFSYPFSFFSITRFPVRNRVWIDLARRTSSVYLITARRQGISVCSIAFLCDGKKKFLQKSTSEATSTTQIDGSCNLFPPPFAGITKRNVIKFRYLKIKNLVAPREKKFSIIISFTIERGKRSKESFTRQSHHQHFKKAHNKTGKVL